MTNKKLIKKICIISLIVVILVLGLIFYIPRTVKFTIPMTDRGDLETTLSVELHLHRSIKEGNYVRGKLAVDNQEFNVENMFENSIFDSHFDVFELFDDNHKVRGLLTIDGLQAEVDIYEYVSADIKYPTEIAERWFGATKDIPENELRKIFDKDTLSEVYENS